MRTTRLAAVMAASLALVPGVPGAFVAAGAIGLTAGVVTAGAAHAGPFRNRQRHGGGLFGRRGRNSPVLGAITVQSQYGSETATGAIRFDSHGVKQVQTPGGSWINCFGGCAHALRSETVDFWETRREEAVGVGTPY